MVDLFRLRLDEGFFLVLRNVGHNGEIGSEIFQICKILAKDVMALPRPLYHQSK